jgi:hypothetical protein
MQVFIWMAWLTYDEGKILHMSYEIKLQVILNDNIFGLLGHVFNWYDISFCFLVYN